VLGDPVSPPNLPSIPIVRLTLERMEFSILAALSEYEAKLDEDLQAAVKEFCQPENVKLIIGRHVREALDRTIREEVETFYRIGPGRAKVREAIYEALG
jgi:hypothetical protein